VTSLRPRKCRRSATLVVLVGAALAAPSPAAELVAVAELLRSLTATGVEVLYSSDLVPATLAVPQDLAETDPMARAIAALGLHHLVLRNAGYRRFIVTRAERPRAPVNVEPAGVTTPDGGMLTDVSVFGIRPAVTGTAVGEPVEFGASEIEKVPGAQADALRAVRSAPGIASNLSSRPYVRGAFLDNVLVRFDGVPLWNPFHFRSFQSLISAFDPSAVDRADVYTGGFPVSYGTRSAGVIDLAPRSVASGYDHRIGASLASYDIASAGRSDQWPVEWLATMRHSASDVSLRPIDGDRAEPTFFDTLGRVRFQTDPASAWTLGWLMLRDDVRLASDPTEEQATASFHDVYTWLTFEQSLTGGLHSRTSVMATRSELQREGSLSLAGVANAQLTEGRDATSVELRTEWIYVQSDRLTWTFGAEAALASAALHFARQEQFAAAMASGFGRSPDATLSSDQAPRSATQGFFASGRWRWRAVEAELGLRADRQDYRSLSAHAQLSPRLNVRYDPAPAWHVYGSWGFFTQAQRIDEWRSEEGQSLPDSAGRAIHVIGGLAHESAGAIEWRVEAYRNHWSSISPYFDNSLDAAPLLPELEPDRVRIAPNGAETAGVELSARRALGLNFDTWGSYVLSHAVDDLNGRDVPRSWDQTHAANFGIAWNWARTAASLAVGWHSGWPTTPLLTPLAAATSPAYVAVGARNTVRSGNYLAADMRLSQTLPVGYGQLSLWLDATNVTDRRNDCCVGFIPPADGAGLPGLEPKAWLPRAVNVGFVWQLREER
jgi:hypothetical protein